MLIVAVLTVVALGSPRFSSTINNASNVPFGFAVILVFTPDGAVHVPTPKPPEKTLITKSSLAVVVKLFVANDVDADTAFTVPSHYHLVGLSGVSDSPTIAASVWKAGHNEFFQSHLVSGVSNALALGVATTHQAPISGWMPYDRCYLASPWAFASEDTLTVLVDNDVVSKRYTVPMFRRLAAVNDVYNANLQFLDADNSNNEIQDAFGVDFDFNDFAVFMTFICPAKLVSHTPHKACIIEVVSS